MWYRAIWKDDGWALMTVYFVLEIQLKMALMKVDVSTTAFILTFISTLQCNAWLLLSASLVHQFAKINNRFSIVFHLPSHDNDNIIHVYKKMFRYNKWNWGQHWACNEWYVVYFNQIAGAVCSWKLVKICICPKMLLCTKRVSKIIVPPK